LHRPSPHARRAAEIGICAEKKWGELYAPMEKAKGAQGQIHKGMRGATGGSRSASPVRTKPLAEMGVSNKQTAERQKLPAIREDQFEAARAGAKKPMTFGVFKFRRCRSRRRGATRP
jgi:hypothetical protein